MNNLSDLLRRHEEAYFAQGYKHDKSPTDASYGEYMNGLGAYELLQELSWHEIDETKI